MKKISIAVAMILIAASSYVLGWSSLFVVKSVVIAEKDKAIKSEVLKKLQEPSAVLELGEPIARVDKRTIATRLRELIWVDQVEINRNILSGEVKITVKSRSAIARLASSNESKPGTIDFLGSDLKTFAIPLAEVDRAARSGDRDWRELPVIAMGRDSLELREDIATLIRFLEMIGARSSAISARDSQSLVTKVLYQGRQLDISWGNVKDLEVKSTVMNRILELKENRAITKIDLSSPLSPVVSR